MSAGKTGSWSSNFSGTGFEAFRVVQMNGSKKGENRGGFDSYLDLLTDALKSCRSPCDRQQRRDPRCEVRDRQMVLKRRSEAGGKSFGGQYEAPPMQTQWHLRSDFRCFLFFG